MSVYLLRSYQGFPASSTVPVTFADATETALIAQGLATAAAATDVSVLPPGTAQFVYQGGSIAPFNGQGQSTPAYPQGPLILPNIPLGSAALTGYNTNGSVHVAGTVNIAEIYVPYYNTWTGLGWLNGTTVGTASNKFVGALYSSSGALITTTALGGTASAGASVMQNVAFLAPQFLAPGRYFLGLQCEGTTDTTRKILAANGANMMTTSFTGTFGTIPASFTVPTTFTTAVGVIMQLYT